MPVADHVEEPLKSALEDMEAQVQSTKRNLGFAAPEVQDEKWAELQVGLAQTLSELYSEALNETPPDDGPKPNWPEED